MNTHTPSSIILLPFGRQVSGRLTTVHHAEGAEFPMKACRGEVESDGVDYSHCEVVGVFTHLTKFG